MYPPNQNPTELYYERQALLRQEARNKRLARRPLEVLSTMLVVLDAFVSLASILVGPGRAIEWVGTYLVQVVEILGLLIVVIGLSMWEGRKIPDDGTKPLDRLNWDIL